LFEILRAGPLVLGPVTNRSLPAYRLVHQASRVFLCTSDSFRILRAGPCLFTYRSSCSLDAVQKGPSGLQALLCTSSSFRLTCFFSLYSTFEGLYSLVLLLLLGLHGSVCNPASFPLHAFYYEQLLDKQCAKLQVPSTIQLGLNLYSCVFYIKYK
jgi:hypothetical protein